MKFIIEVDDFWLEDQEIEEGLKNHVKYEVLREIKLSIKDQVERTITKVIKEKVSKSLEKTIQKEVTKAVTDIKIPNSFGSESKTLQEHIIYDFNQNSRYRDPKRQIEESAKKFGTELKNRYDMLFASQIVIKMGEQGLLKDGVLDALIEKK